MGGAAVSTRFKELVITGAILAMLMALGWAYLQQQEHSDDVSLSVSWSGARPDITYSLDRATVTIKGSDLPGNDAEGSWTHHMAHVKGSTYKIVVRNAGSTPVSGKSMGMDCVIKIPGVPLVQKWLDSRTGTITCGPVTG
jgi:hypothetical protein